jgi:hypothetical protein
LFGDNDSRQLAHTRTAMIHHDLSLQAKRRTVVLEVLHCGATYNVSKVVSMNHQQNIKFGIPSYCDAAILSKLAVSRREAL